jgi:16S rRNA processing protein RimM
VDLGRIVGVFGLNGAVKVQPLTDFPERFDPGEQVWVRGQPVRIVESHWHKGQVRLALEGFSTVEAAESLLGEGLTMPRSARPKLGSGEYYHDQLVGLEVVTDEGRTIGVVDEVLPTPASGLLRVGEILIPVVKEFVLRVDLCARRVTVRLIPGMAESGVPDEVR